MGGHRPNPTLGRCRGRRKISEAIHPPYKQYNRVYWQPNKALVSAKSVNLNLNS